MAKIYLFLGQHAGVLPETSLPINVNSRDAPSVAAISNEHIIQASKTGVT